MSIQLIQQAICYMEEHIYENINYTDVAKSVHMSNYNFHRTFSFIALVKAFPNEIINDDNDHSIPDFWTECYEKNLIEPLKLLRTEGKRDLYGLCSPVIDHEDRFNYGIGILIDEDTDITELDKLKNNGYSVWETEPADYAVFKCFGPDSDCLGETWDKFFKEFTPQTGYYQTDDTDYEIYFENGESGLFCELWVPIRKDSM